MTLGASLLAAGCGTPEDPSGGETGITNNDVGDADDGGTTLGATGGETGTAGDEGTTVSADTTAGNDDEDPGSPIKHDVLGVPDAAGGGHCPLITVESEPMVVPADIIIAVDTSGSMNTEAQDVQDNLNAFSQQIVDAGVDARVILIAEAPNGFSGICIEPPLGGGGCPATDDNSPLFLHVDTTVFSTDAFDRIISEYPQYSANLRPEAVKQLLIVSDDNSWPTTPAEFDAAFVALDPTHFGYTQHGIVSVTNCPAAAQIGQAYIDLAMSTNGIIGDLCLQDFQPVFDELAEAVVDNSIPCTYQIPSASGGPQDAETAEVQVDFGDGQELIEPVDSPDLCDPNEDNWFFDDPKDPQQIIFCPFTCLRLKQSKEASVEIAITCAPASE